MASKNTCVSIAATRQLVIQDAPEIDLSTASWKANAILFHARATLELLHKSEHFESDESLVGVSYNLSTIAEAAEYLALQLSMLADPRHEGRQS
jgi:hypothetical protein